MTGKIIVPIETREDMDALNAGKIDFVEFQRRQYVRTRNELESRLLEHRQKGEWKDFVKMALSRYEVMPLAFSFYDEVPDSMKYKFCTEAYTHHGDSIPAVRKAVRAALKYGKPILPEDMARQEVITVYRAGEEPIEKAKYRISWTTDINTALFFLNTYTHRHAEHLYTGKIKPDRIIAYTNDRKESEIMQYGNVYDIQEAHMETRQ